MDKEQEKIEKELTEYVNKNKIQEVKVVIDKLWKGKSVKLIVR